MGNISIIKDMELPPKPKGVRKHKYPFERLDLNEAFFVPNKTVNGFGSYVGVFGRRLGRKFCTRTVIMKMVDGEWKPVGPAETGTPGVLVMRTE